MDNRRIARQRPRPEPKFHLAQCSLKKIHAVARAYYVIGRPATLEEVGLESELSQAAVCSMQDFLVDMGILRGNAQRKQLRAVGMELGKAIKSRRGDAAINRTWRRAVCQSTFCIQVLKDARAEGKMEKNRFIYLLFTAAGYRPRDLSHDYTTGTKALISIFRRAGLVRRVSGYFTVGRSIERLSKCPQNEMKRYDDFISPEHIACLEELQAEGRRGSGLSRLLGYCNEINDNHRRGNTLSVMLLCQAIVDHIQPLLGERTFEPTASQPGPASMKEATDHLLSIRGIPMNDAASSAVEADYRADMSILIGRVIELMHEHGEPAKAEVESQAETA